MNAPHPLQRLTPHVLPVEQPSAGEDGGMKLLEYLDIVLDNKVLVASVAALALALGSAYAVLARPVYETNLLIQVEDSSTSAKSFLGEAASLFDVKTPATAEIEILRSRMIIGQAVDATHLYIDARPRYIPVIGRWLSTRATHLSSPGIFGMGGWVAGTESIEVARFDVPVDFEGSRFLVKALGQNRYSVTHPDIEQPIAGVVGVPLSVPVTGGALTLLVTQLAGNPGAEFNLARISRLDTIERLQDNLKLAERGRQSGIIDATLQDTDRDRLTVILNEIGRQYVRQNVERKAAEAQKTLTFLDTQLPQFKKQLDQSEEAYNKYRNLKGTVSLDEEAKMVLGRAVDLQTKLMEAQQKRVELLSRFTSAHPAVQTLDTQIASLQGEIAGLNGRIKTMPSVQQDALRLERDVKVNNELYQQLRNNALQLQLIREGKIGNVRLIDPAAAPEIPVRPKRPLIVLASLVLGLLAGVAVAVTRNNFFRGLKSAQEVEAGTGLNVYSTIPLSDTQETIARLVATKTPGIHVLAQSAPHDVAVESLRSLRTALQFAMLDASNNRVVISGATPGVGKSFVSANFAAVLASAGRRVLLIDADLRKGHLNQYFGIRREHGLSELVTGSISLDQAIRRELVPNLDLMTTGVLPPNPAELFVSTAFVALLDELSKKYDLVLIDTAPVLAAADTSAIASHVGTVLLVVRSDLTQLGELRESARRLAHAGSTVTGVLFNAVDLTRRHYGNYGYKYGGYKYRNYEYTASTEGH